MKDRDVRSLVAYRLDEAREALSDAELLLDAGRCRSAANRMYYAVFYAAVAALLTKQLEFSRHSGVIAFFDKEFIHTGILPKEYSRTLHRAFNERQQDDYIVEMSPDELKQLLVNVRHMVNGISTYIKERA
jgi:uncharacterized protein (UPF0332 family)